MGIVSKLWNRMVGEEVHYKRTVPYHVLWDKYLAMKEVKDNSLLGVSKPYAFYGDLTSYYSGTNNVMVLYRIEAYPESLKVNYKVEARKRMKGSTKVTFIEKTRPHSIDFESDVIKAKARAMDNRNQEFQENTTGKLRDLADDKSTVKQLGDFEDSYRYFLNCKVQNISLLDLQTQVLVSGTRGEAFDESVKQFEDYMSSIGFKMERVMGNMDTQLTSVSPFSLQGASLTNKEYYGKQNTIVISDEIYSRQFSYTHGTSSVGTMLLGLDIYSNIPVLKDGKNSSDSAENYLIGGETGSGKSHKAKFFSIQLLSHQDYVGTINDIEGGEYLPLVEVIRKQSPDQVKVLNMGEGTGLYLDPVPIHLTGILELDEGMYTYSKNFLIGFFKTLITQKVLDEYAWIGLSIENSIINFYREIGIVETDMSTWAKTQNYTIRDVYQHILNTDFDSDEAKSQLEFLKKKLEVYFGTNDQDSLLFKESITFKEIANLKLLICSFGLAGKAVDTLDPVSMGLMQMYAATISHLRSIFSKARGKFNFKIWEELPRWADFPNADKILKTALVGGRKLGDLNIIITNQPGELLENDRFKLFESITTYILGAMADVNVRKGFCERLGFPQLQGELDKINANREERKVKQVTRKDLKDEYNSVMKNPYKKAFLVCINRVDFYVSKVYLPEHLSNSSLFKTGVQRVEE